MHSSDAAGRAEVAKLNGQITPGTQFFFNSLKWAQLFHRDKRATQPPHYQSTASCL